MVLTTDDQAGALGLEQGGHVGQRLAGLGGHAAVDEGAVDQAQLPGHDQPVAGPDDRRVGPEGLAQWRVRRSSSRSRSYGWRWGC